MKTKKFKFWRTIRNILLTLVGTFILWILFHQTISIFEHYKYPPLGKLVEVEGKNMHVYSKGKGEKTIVLLSGAGTASPILDFQPLIKELSKNYKVVVVEPFGYGWSDLTKKERSVENIVEEIRSALHKANIQGPFILMPHSISGIYSMYYVNKYPNEIEAIIGIDCTLPKMADYFDEKVPQIPKFMTMFNTTGLSRIAVNVNPKNYLPIAHKDTYSEDNLKMTKIISSWKLSNKNVVSEVNEINNNFQTTFNMSFPNELPVMIFTKKNQKLNKDGKNNITFYQEQLENVTYKKLVPIEGHHYLHWTNYKEISMQTNEFINSYVVE